MNVSLPSRTLTVALALAMATVAVLIALAPQALAQGRKAGCQSKATARPSHACSESKRTAGSSHKGKAHSRPKGRGHHSKPAASNNSPAGAARKTPTTKPSAGKHETLATCENGSVPVREKDGYFSCSDESEPICENGSIPTVSENGASLLCGVDPGAGTMPLPATCEDGSIPLRAGDGSFSCDDESAPGCENGSAPTLSSDHSVLVCDLAATESIG